MLEQLRKSIAATGPFQELARRIGDSKETRIKVQGLSGSLMAFAASFLLEEHQTQILMVVSDEDRAEKLRDDCALLLGDQRVCLFAANAAHHAKVIDMTAPIAQIETLRKLLSQENVLVLVPAEALLNPVPPPSSFAQRTILLEASREYPFSPLLENLASLGFERKDFVEEYGDFAVRGGILDVFPYVGDNPIRMEFWGDSLESIREFDVLSQRSIKDLQAASIVASLEPSSEQTTQPSSSVVDYLAKDALVVLDEPELLQSEIAEIAKERNDPGLEWTGYAQRLDEFRTIVHSSLGSKSSGISFEATTQPAINGSIKHLLDQIQKYTNDNQRTVIACDTHQESERLRELIEEELTAPPSFVESAENDLEREPDAGREGDSREEKIETLRPEDRALHYELMTETLHSGFVYPAARLVLFTEHEIFGRLKRRGLQRRKAFRGFTTKEIQQLKRGDFVVHVDYGIGRFAGLHKIKIRGAEQEVMKVEYAEKDTLYVNLNFVNRVQKYSSQEGHVPTLTKLGSPDWDRLKGRARKKIKDIARDLIKLYARRKAEEGFAFAPDTHWQKEMEASFMYEDTPDQATATLDVKKDMESKSPMDRLICGDVGFGKTEIAVRAAFKAVMDGKQAAVLVPTTILAQQHYNTFMDRLSRYSVRIESLSRFKSKKEQSAVVQALREKQVDILIGTHRILSKDIVFKDIGLLIIDEEHRFGVAAKEKLRHLRATIDTLTLTATPIPRTLQFSLMGSRDLSIINTPPRNRLPIITEIVPLDWRLVREAILREIHRGGQVYFIHDRVQNMDEMFAILKKHVPEARVHSAHGQMKGHELERTMLDFLEKKYDVLLCTKIIESGIDIPSVNTIIIHRADRFGLAELYQLRGRVGRSNVQAYAHLLTPPLSILPKSTLRRLQAIQEFTELGSGFNLAMRDLEIRGAGNLLGAEQSGVIMEMGFEMYQRIVEEAVQELKEEEFKELVEGRKAGSPDRVETVIETDVEAFIPDLYVESDAERLDIYRRLYKTMSPQDVDIIRVELKDRFGEYPAEVEHLFRSVQLRVRASAMMFVRIELSGSQLALHLPQAEVKAFYESESNQPTEGLQKSDVEGAKSPTSPFQHLMNRVGVAKQYKLHLKQDGKTLKLIGSIGDRRDAGERLNAVQELLELLDAREEM
jgi:transcription-repair coupling factor (superfamily II helicase)